MIGRVEIPAAGVVSDGVEESMADIVKEGDDVIWGCGSCTVMDGVGRGGEGEVYDWGKRPVLP